MWLTVGEAAFPGGALRWQDSGVTQAMALQESCLGQMALGVCGDIYKVSLLCLRCRHVWGRENTLPCAVSAPQLLCGPRPINLKKKKFFLGHLQNTAYFYVEKKGGGGRQLSLRENSLKVLKI